MTLFKTSGMQNGDMVIFFLRSFRKVRFRKMQFLEDGVLVFPPVPKKGMVRLLKKGTFNARQHVKRALLAPDDKQRALF